ncbi:hypothetical protein F4556_006595 [Kitasatospora gansuensis]|uniref:Uncharacterized protein n=1 Tax=Kitasatospora gansuensis TaxID=258050 RepID=A0A7W7WLH3_9ACTN|nr:hypothetical protein [Kitasatospora gansuensis]
MGVTRRPQVSSPEERAALEPAAATGARVVK